MNTRLDMSPQAPDATSIDIAPLVIDDNGPRSSGWFPNEFAEQQIRTLVRKVFLPGWPKPSRQVVLSAIDPEAYIADICVRVARALAAEISGSVAVVEGNPERPELETVFGDDRNGSTGESPAWLPVREHFRTLRADSIQISSRVWLVPWKLFRGEQREGSATAIMRDRFAELRLDFDYTIMHGPVGSSSEAALLAHLSDGIILVLEAGKTRRLAAQKAKEALHSANAKLLGTVLSERQFPIPAGIYRKL
jgi:hypothetical protein